MTRQIYVTRLQRDAARLLIELREARGEPVEERWRAIASAAPEHGDEPDNSEPVVAILRDR